MKNTVFAQNPDLKSYHETSDGIKFFKDSDAITHARSLRDKEIKKVTRGSLMVDEVLTEVKAKKVKALEASEAKNITLPITAMGAHPHPAPKVTAKVDQPTAPETLTPMAQAKLRIEDLEKLETVEAVEKALEGETAKSVKKAGRAKIEALEAAEKKEL